MALKEMTPEQAQELDELVAKARRAQKVIETYDQARVDRLCKAVAWAISNKQTFLKLVDMGIEESGLGDPVSRQGKRFKIRGILRDALRQKSIGPIEEIPERHSEICEAGRAHRFAGSYNNPRSHPRRTGGVWRQGADVIIFSPHPRSKKTTFENVRIMREALEKEEPCRYSSVHYLTILAMTQAHGRRPCDCYRSCHVHSAYSSAHLLTAPVPGMPR